MTWRWGRGGLHRSAVGNPGIFNSSKAEMCFQELHQVQKQPVFFWFNLNQTLCLCVCYSWDKKKIWLRSKRSISRKENITRIPRIPRSSPTQEKAVYKSKWFSPVCSQTSPPAGPEDKVPSKMRQDFKSSYCPAVLTARCCSSMDLRAGDIMGGGMAGVKGRSGYCAFLPGK